MVCDRVEAWVEKNASALDIAQLRCEGCGTLADAACGCGVGYLPVKALDAAAKAIAADPQSSDATIAAKIGVSRPTVQRARATQPAQNEHVETRRGRDGKTRKMPTPSYSAEDVDGEDGITTDMVDAANATNRRRVFLRCAADTIRKAEQGEGRARERRAWGT